MRKLVLILTMLVAVFVSLSAVTGREERIQAAATTALTE